MIEGQDTHEFPKDGKKKSSLPPFDDPKYRAALDDCEMTEEQATEFLRALDFILRAFVDLGWGVDAVQLAIPALAEFNKQSESLADFSGASESRTGTVKQSSNFNNAATDLPQKE